MLRHTCRVVCHQKNAFLVGNIRQAKFGACRYAVAKSQTFSLRDGRVRCRVMANCSHERQRRVHRWQFRGCVALGSQGHSSCSSQPGGTRRLQPVRAVATISCTCPRPPRIGRFPGSTPVCPPRHRATRPPVTGPHALLGNARYLWRLPRGRRQANSDGLTWSRPRRRPPRPSQDSFRTGRSRSRYSPLHKSITHPAESRFASVNG